MTRCTSLAPGLANQAVGGIPVQEFASTARRILIRETSIPMHVWADVMWQGEGAAGLRILQPTEAKPKWNTSAPD